MTKDEQVLFVNTVILVKELYESFMNDPNSLIKVQNVERYKKHIDFVNDYLNKNYNKDGSPKGELKACSRHKEREQD